ncbi:hypothetical protein D9M73_260960 [compost metagenome]
MPSAFRTDITSSTASYFTERSAAITTGWSGFSFWRWCTKSSRPCLSSLRSKALPALSLPRAVRSPFSCTVTTIGGAFCCGVALATVGRSTVAGLTIGAATMKMTSSTSMTSI